MARKVVQVDSHFLRDEEAVWVSQMWDTYHRQRAKKIEEWLEVRNFVFATDTSTTSVAPLPWQNSTTTPKLCQIRDNLHSNYISALFPNDRWLKWEGSSDNDSRLTKARTIEGYMSNKCRESHFRTTISKLVYDYIDYGNAFATVEFVTEYKKNRDGSRSPSYIGPRAVRISPLDIVFNPMAESFIDTPKIVRSVKTLGEIAKLVVDNPEQLHWRKFLERRQKTVTMCTALSSEDFNKNLGFQADGFGDMREYFLGDLVEVLEFYGDYYNSKTGVLEENRVITIADRSVLIRNEAYSSWFGHAPIYHVGWRFRQDNLWAMGPLDNLVGMQYRIDHLENMKADVWDLVVHPPLAIVGEVEEFMWGPGVEIHLDEGGRIEPLTRDMSALAMTNNEIANVEAKMEMYAGAPREAMGIRTPGEKTALEVQTLNTAAGRIFQEKTTQFEMELLEPVLNAMLETAIRNMDGNDTVKVINDDIGVEVFRTITRDDITAVGALRPVGARHFSKQAQDLQNLTQLMQTPIGQYAMPHMSGKAAYKLIEDIAGISSYKLFSDFVAIAEQQEQAQLTNYAQESFEMAATTPPLQGL